MNPCTCKSPVSYLRLEQLALGELSWMQRRRVVAELAACPACTRALALIQADHVTLKPLRAPTSLPRARPGWTLPLLLSALTTALVVVVLPPQDENRAKGDDVSSTLIRERNGALSAHPERFATTDRFKLSVNCALPSPILWDVAIWQSDGMAFPLRRQEKSCGNDITLEGAFRITRAEAAAVCVLHGSRLPSRDDLLRGGFSELADQARCHWLVPE